jgi:hypothetical protein
MATLASPLAEWESFYVIVGTSAAALTGLQFVVIALAAEAERRSTSREIAAFGTPTVIHFCAALLVSAIVSAPWLALRNTGIALGACGIAGIGYAALVVVRASSQTTYKPVLEDWLWHAVFPLGAYLALLVASVVLPRRPEPALFVVATAALLLLFIGIHNAWDTVTYIAFERWEQPREADSRASPAGANPLTEAKIGSHPEPSKKL